MEKLNKDIPLSSYAYFASCELSDAIDNLETIISRLDDPLAKSLVYDIVSDINSSLDKLNNVCL